MSPDDKYIPALRSSWLTPIYDPLTRLFMREEKSKNRLIDNAGIQAGQKILDLGCGTATLTLMLKRAHPETEVVGLDADRQILEIARRKVEQARVDLALDEGTAFDLPYQDETFDRVLSSLVIHHLTGENKERTFGEVYRVLRPGGELHIMDFGPPHGLYARLVSGVISRLEPVGDNIQGRLVEMMRDAGFSEARIVGRFGTLLGTLAYYKAIKPS